MKGNAAGAMAQAAKNFENTYRWPFQMHAMIGPSCAVADVRGDKATDLVGFAGAVYHAQRRGAAARACPSTTSTSSTRRLGLLRPAGTGRCPRRRGAAVARGGQARARAMDARRRTRLGAKGPPQLISIRSGIDAQGKVIAWEYNERTLPWTDARLSPMLASRQTGIKPDENGIFLGGNDGARIQFRKPQSRRLRHSLDHDARIRCAPATCARPTARRAASPPNRKWTKWPPPRNADPLEFRLRHLSGPDSKRVVDVLRAVTEQSRNGSRARRTRQAAIGQYRQQAGAWRFPALAGTVVAQVADIEVDKSSGKVAVKKITVAHDCGIIVNPDGLRNQIEGNVVQGASRALMEEVDFDAAGVKSLNWSSYPIIRFSEVPEVEIVLINRPELEPMGAGEAASHRHRRGDRECHLRRRRRAPARSAVHAGPRASRAAKRQGLRRRREAVFGSFLHVFDR